MPYSVAKPEDILVAYDPDTVTNGDQASLLEVHRVPFKEMTGGADTYYSDFTAGLHEFVAARLGKTMTSFEGGADPSAVVLGIDFAEEPTTPERGNLSDLIISAESLPISTRQDKGRTEPPHDPKSAHPNAAIIDNDRIDISTAIADTAERHQGEKFEQNTAAVQEIESIADFIQSTE